MKGTPPDHHQDKDLILKKEHQLLQWELENRIWIKALPAPSIDPCPKITPSVILKMVSKIP